MARAIPMRNPLSCADSFTFRLIYNRLLKKAGLPRSGAEITKLWKKLHTWRTYPVRKESSEIRRGRVDEQQWIDGLGKGGMGFCRIGDLHFRVHLWK